MGGNEIVGNLGTLGHKSDLQRGEIKSRRYNKWGKIFAGWIILVQEGMSEKFVTITGIDYNLNLVLLSPRVNGSYGKYVIGVWIWGGVNSVLYMWHKMNWHLLWHFWFCDGI